MESRDTMVALYLRGHPARARWNQRVSTGYQDGGSDLGNGRDPCVERKPEVGRRLAMRTGV